MYQALTLIRFGRFDEVVEITKRPEREIPGAAFDFSQGYAKLKLGDADFAKGLPGKSEEGRRHVERRVPQPHRGAPGRRAGRHPRRGDHAHGRRCARRIAKFETAVKLDDEMDYDEPEPLPFPARHWLGAALLEAKRYAAMPRRSIATTSRSIRTTVGAAWIATGAESAGQERSAVRCRPRQELGKVGHWIKASRF
jgi:hypothetical protein